jgi:hypothetical protein
MPTHRLERRGMAGFDLVQVLEHVLRLQSRICRKRKLRSLRQTFPSSRSLEIPLGVGLSCSVASGYGQVSRSDMRGNSLILLDVNTAGRVGIDVEFVIGAGDFDSAIPRFESWRPSQPYLSTGAA